MLRAKRQDLAYDLKKSGGSATGNRLGYCVKYQYTEVLLRGYPLSCEQRG